MFLPDFDVYIEQTHGNMDIIKKQQQKNNVSDAKTIWLIIQNSIKQGTC